VAIGEEERGKKFTRMEAMEEIAERFKILILKMQQQSLREYYKF
jgi:hypothetical protein